MPRLRLLRWWKRRSTDDLHRLLVKYEEEIEAHRQAAETARSIGFDAGYAHQMEIKAWYEREAEKLRGEVARHRQKGRR